MELIILDDGLYQLIPVTKQMMEHISLLEPVNCMDLCEILRLKLTGYVDTLNLHIMNDGSGSMVGCICRQTYPKEGKIRIGYCGEMLLPYHIFATISNSFVRCAIKLNKHVILINICTTYLFHFFNRFFITKHQTIVLSIKPSRPFVGL